MAHIIEDQQNYHKNLSGTVVAEIREGYLSGLTQKELADSYNVSIKTIYKIIHLKDYKWVKASIDYLDRLDARLGR